MEVVNEKDIFITLAKYNTHQRRKKGKPLLAVYNVISILIPLKIAYNVFMSNDTCPWIFIGRVYNIYIVSSIPIWYKLFAHIIWFQVF